jgi:hypothetical protein
MSLENITITVGHEKFVEGQGYKPNPWGTAEKVVIKKFNGRFVAHVRGCEVKGPHIDPVIEAIRKTIALEASPAKPKLAAAFLNTFPNVQATIIAEKRYNLR